MIKTLKFLNFKTSSSTNLLHEKPILIVGLMRSGTTLLDRMIDAHPKIQIFFVRTQFLRKLNGKFDPLNKKNLDKLLHEVADFLQVWGRKTTEDEIAQVKEYVKQHHKLNYKSVYLGLAKTLLHISDDERWGEKYDGHGGEIKYFMKMFPKGQVILITRDLRDSYASNKKRTKEVLDAHAFLRGDHLMLLDDWKRMADHWNNFSSHYDKESHLHITYEELIENPETTTRKICEFLKIDWSEDMINPKKFLDWDGKQWRANTSFDTIAYEISKNNVNKHRDELSDEEMVLVESYMRKYPIRDDPHHYKYVTDGLSKNTIPLEEKLKNVVDSWKEARDF
ncbi:Putative sulfotransferase [Nitrosotalea devaniterrae]|uniref:Sulfotransferase n=1 Tax=Nitrosotalea devaniterrae TaxID=1078905 RepID=A0A128A0M3_9ARCH|nr:Putative sulfotransferase [Candidatus Nitrosotalea devanaterra]